MRVCHGLDLALAQLQGDPTSYDPLSFESWQPRFGWRVAISDLPSSSIIVDGRTPGDGTISAMGELLYSKVKSQMRRVRVPLIFLAPANPPADDAMVPCSNRRNTPMRLLPMFYLACLSCISVGSSAGAQEWTRFRGPNGSGISTAMTPPVKWTDKDYRWKAELPGVGHSSPVLWGERIFLTSADPKTGKRIVLCLSSVDGKTLWTREFETKTYPIHLRNSFATATPAVDRERLYTTWATPEQYTAIALDHDGKMVWQAELGPYMSQHGVGVSPILFEDLLIVPNDQDNGGSLVALDTQTGKVRWKIPRHPKNATYSTPCIYQGKNREPELIFTNWQHGITAIDPKTGKTNWELSIFDTKKQERAVASPVIAGDLILSTCGFVTAQKHFVAVRPGDPAKGTPPVEVWRLEKAVAYLPTPLVKGEHVFLCSELGIASCLEAATGKVLWQERLGGVFSASPICVGDRIYCVSNDGEVVVLAASDKFAVLARNPLGEVTQATPAAANRQIYFRTRSNLIALGEGK